MADKNKEEKPDKPDKPKESDKLSKETSYDETIKIFIKGKEVSAVMKVKTKPNNKGGYDTVVQIPTFVVGQNLKT